MKEVPGDTTVVGDTTTSSKKHKEAVKVIEYNKQVRHSGRIKFYHEKNKYGFITPDNPADRKGDIFVYEDALIKETKLTLKELSEVKKNGGRSIHVTYCLYRYLGNDGEEREKAVDLEIIKNTPAPAQGQS